jgi:hypothetical protein
MATIDFNPADTASFQAQVNNSTLLGQLLSFFTGTITTTKPPATGTFISASTISISPDLMPGSGVAGQELTWPQLATVIAHELAHFDLKYGSSKDPGASYVSDAIDPAESVRIGERNESEAYVAQYVVALQLGDMTLYSRTPDLGRLQASLASAAKANSITSASVQSWGISELTGSPFYSYATGTSSPDTNKVLTVGSVGPIVEGTHVSGNPILTYKAFWQPSACVGRLV